MQEKIMGVKIIGTGSYLPSQILNNLDLEKIVDTSDEWIKARTGICERRIAHQKEASSDLAVKAGRLALESANISPDEIDLIVVATATPDMPFPSTACFIQKGLKAFSSACFDVSAACSGFLYALTIGEQFIKSGFYKTVLVVGAETFSRIIDWTDRNTCVLFGDGAGACILKNGKDNQGIMAFDLGTDSRASELLMVPGGGSRNPINAHLLENRLQFIKMKGNDVFKHAVKHLVSSARNVLKKSHMVAQDIDLVIPHQANIRIIEAISGRLDIPITKFFINLDKYGNTSAASIPIALDEAVKSGRVKKDDNVLLAAFGGGLVWGSCILKW
ncbi:MAG: beta-ketoacyl-ACP synthase III [bacterium]